jgi:hypothetical protein
MVVLFVTLVLALVLAVPTVGLSLLVWIGFCWLVVRGKKAKARERYSDTAKAVRELKRNIAQDRHSGPPAKRIPSRIKTFRDLAFESPDNDAMHEILSLEIFMAFNAARDDGDPALRDALLDELRSVAAKWPDSTAVRERLAKALFNTLLDVEHGKSAARGGALLAELRSLADEWQDDEAVRGVLQLAER